MRYNRHTQISETLVIHPPNFKVLAKSLIITPLDIICRFVKEKMSRKATSSQIGYRSDSELYYFLDVMVAHK